jgi:hypothetical protein
MTANTNQHFAEFQNSAPEAFVQSQDKILASDDIHDHSQDKILASELDAPTDGTTFANGKKQEPHNPVGISDSEPVTPRRKRICGLPVTPICMIIVLVVVILAILAIVLGVVFGTRHSNNKCKTACAFQHREYSSNN